MAIAYRSSSNAAGSGLVTSLSISAPAGLLDGDMLVAVVACDYYPPGTTANSFAINAPTGWTSVLAGGFLHVVGTGAGTDTKIMAFQKQAGGTEPSSYIFTITNGLGNSGNMAMSMAAFSGASPTQRTNSYVTSSNSGSSVNSATLTGVTATDMTILLGGCQTDLGSAAAVATGGSTSGGGGSWITPAASQSSSSGSGHASCATAITYKLAGNADTYDAAGGGGTNTYNQGVISVAYEMSTTVLVPDTDFGSGVDAASARGLASELGSGVDNAAVLAVIPATDTGSGLDAGLSLVPIPGADVSSLTVDAAVVRAYVTAADSGSGIEQFTVYNVTANSTLAFGADTGTHVSSGVANLAGSYGDTASANDTAQIAIQGPIPSSYQRVIRVQQEVDIVTATS